MSNYDFIRVSFSVYTMVGNNQVHVTDSFLSADVAKIVADVRAKSKNEVTVKESDIVDFLHDIVLNRAAGSVKIIITETKRVTFRPYGEVATKQFIASMVTPTVETTTAVDEPTEQLEEEQAEEAA